MNPRIVAAIAAVALMVAIAASSGAFSSDKPGDDPAAPAGQYETTEPAESGASTTDGRGGPAGSAGETATTPSTFSDDEAAEQTPADQTAVGTPLLDPAATASAFGCGYAEHPEGETAAEHAFRLAALATGDLTAAVADLSVNGFGDLTVTADPGAVTQLPGTRDWWEVRCATATVRPDGTPGAPPGAVTLHVRVARQADGAWRATELSFPGSG